VSITYEVVPGRRFTLTDIRITGTEHLSVVDVEELKDELRSQEANLFGVIPLLGYGNGYTSNDALEQDRNTIRLRMVDLGYRHADVDVIQGVSLEGDNLIITFRVREGKLTRVAGVDVRGNQIFTSKELKDERCPREPLPDEACLIEGGAYSRRQARTDGERIRTFYARKGYVDADVDLAVVELPPSPGGDEQVRLVYNVKELEKVFVNRIYVNGNIRTKKEAVLSAIPLREGEVLRADDLQESERILVNQTGDAFRQVIIHTEAAGETASGFPKRDVLIDVEERKRIVMDYGGGFSTDNGPLGLFEIRNSNLFGQLRQGALRLRASRRQQLVRLEYFDPRFRRYGVKDFSPLTISLQYTRDTSVTRFFRSTLDRGSKGIVQRFDEEGNIVDESGDPVKEPSINRFQVNLETQRDLELELGPRGEVRKRSTLFLRYNYEDVRLFNIGSLLLAPVLRPDQAVRLSRLGAAFARDTRDRQFDPTRGDLFRIDYGLALKALGGNLSFSKLITDYSRYYKINRVRETVFAARVQLGLARIYDPPDRDKNGVIDETDRRLPISERFFAGGSGPNTLRGFGFEEAGPRIVAPECFFRAVANPCGTFRNEKGEPVQLDPFTVPIGGNAMAIVNLEARVGLTKMLQAVPFYDGGNVFRRAGDIFRKCETDPADPFSQNSCAKWTHTVGLGLRFKTPFGPLAVDYAYTLNPSEFLVPEGANPPAVHRLRRAQIHFRFGQTF
jgi:outer membrane protein assembly complex protein YaeT